MRTPSLSRTSLEGRSLLVTVMSAASILLLFAADSSAQYQQQQTYQQQRGQYVEGVFKTLVNSRNLGNSPLPAVPEERITPQMRETTRYIQAFANESQKLIDELQFEERYSSYVRALSGDALQVKATADILVQRSQGITDTRELANEYAELDRQWRLLAYHLENTPNLSGNVRDRVKRLNRGNEAIEKQLKLTPQVATSELIRHFAALSEDLANLGEDVRIDLYTHPQRDDIANQLSTLRSRSQQLRLATEYNYPHQDIVAYYKQFHENWLTLKNRMRSIDNRYIQRNISRIKQINNQIHEQLWLQPVIDGQDILFQATDLQTQVQRTGDAITLRQLVEQPNATEIFSKSQEFHTMCNRFKRTVETQTQLESLQWDFRELNVAWADLKSIMNPLTTTQTIQNVAEIERIVGGLRQSLGLDTGYSQQTQSSELASNLNNMADLLYRDVDRYAGNQAAQFANQFRQATQRFQTNLRQGQNESQLRQDTDAMARQWNQLQNALAKIPYQQRVELSRTTQQIGPVLAKLQLIYGFNNFATNTANGTAAPRR